MVIPQWPNGIYLREVFREGLRPKVKMVIVSMPHKTLVEVAKLIILIEEEMSIRRNNMARYWQNFDSEKLEDSNDEEWQRPKKKESKIQFNTYIKGVFSKLL